MSKWVEVIVTAHKVFAVEIEDDQNEQHAIDCAFDEMSGFCELVEIDNNKVEIAETNIEIDRMKRHADEVFKL